MRVALISGTDDLGQTTFPNKIIVKEKRTLPVVQ